MYNICLLEGDYMGNYIILLEEKVKEKKKYLKRKKIVKTIGVIGALGLFAKLRLMLDGTFYMLPDTFLMNIIALIPEAVALGSYGLNDRYNILIDNIDEEIEHLEEKIEQEKLRDIKIKVTELSKTNSEELKEVLDKAELIKLANDIEENKILKTIKDFDEFSTDEKIAFFKDNHVDELIYLSKVNKKEHK